MSVFKKRSKTRSAYRFTRKQLIGFLNEREGIILEDDTLQISHSLIFKNAENLQIQ